MGLGIDRIVDHNQIPKREMKVIMQQWHRRNKTPKKPHKAMRSALKNYMHKLPKYRMEDPEDYGEHYGVFGVPEPDDYGYRAEDFDPNPTHIGMTDLQIPKYFDKVHPTKQIMDLK